MALPYPISSAQTAAGSPIDEQLMNAIRLDLEFLDGKSAAGGASTFRVNNDLSVIDVSKGFGYRLDACVLSSALTLSQAILYCEKTGSAGTLVADCGIYSQYNVSVTTVTAGTGTEKIIQFGSDQSLNMTVGQYAILLGFSATIDPHNYLVQEINRGGAGNYNFVVADTAGRIAVGSYPGSKWAGKFVSIFSVKPSISTINTRAVLSTNAVISINTIPQNSILVMNFDSVMSGGCYNAVLTLR